jgi:membrane protein
MGFFERIAANVRRLAQEPIDAELTRAQRLLRFAVDLARHGGRQLQKDRAMDMAAALTYYTIFSLVPMAVLGLLVFRMFVGVDDARRWMRTAAYDYLGWSSITVPAAPPEGPSPTANTTNGEAPTEAPTPEDGAASAPPPANGGAAAAAAQGQEQAALREGVDQRIDELITRAFEMNLGNIGVIGAALFLWAAVSLLVSLEYSFNVVFNCPAGRSWYRRITTYWAFVTLGPPLVFVSLYSATYAVHWSTENALFGSYTSLLSGTLGRVASIVTSWLVLFLMYVVVPNTGVQIRPALIGSFVAAVLWEFAKWGFRWYVTTALPYSALYGSLGLIPLFLFWLYLTWLIILFGLEITATLQALRGWRLEEQEALRYKDRLLCDPQWLIPVMATIARGFVKGRPVFGEEISRRMRLPLSAVLSMCDRLKRAGYLHQVDTRRREPMAYVLARPPEQISMQGLLELGRSITTNNQRELADEPGWWYVERLSSSLLGSARSATLATVLAGDPRNDEAGPADAPSPPAAPPAEAPSSDGAALPAAPVDSSAGERS